MLAGSGTDRGARWQVERPDWAPEGVDLSRPSAARMYDSLLGGAHNFEIDRQAAAQGVAMVPDLPAVAFDNRAFLRRAVRYLVGQGIRQFVDIGSGIPTVGNVHEVAQQADPACRVVYVDIDGVAVSHGRAILSGNDNAAAVWGDLREPGRILDTPALRELVDLDRPVAVLLVAVLHLLSDDEHPYEAVATLRDAVAPGSYLAISHLTDTMRPAEAGRLAELSTRLGVPITFRPRDQIVRFFDGLTVVEPGVVPLPRWRPGGADGTEGQGADEAEEAGRRSFGFAGVGRRD
ncbi:MAG TPA: SAM-dependent methyltransferase [Pilimelia sp.]|nr:SAM-dependent methyltransferase [Pilimelia sp.]